MYSVSMLGLRYAPGQYRSCRQRLKSPTMASQYLKAACLVTLIVFSGLPPISNAQSIGDIRLSSSCSGRLEVYLNSLTHGERWYQVCDRGMNDTEARVICRQLGCPSTYATTTHASFGYTIIVYYVSRGYRCLGTEQSISSCRQVSGRCTSTSIDGGDNDHVAIICRSSTPPPPPPPSPIDGCVGGRQCLGFSSYCPSNGRYSATCVNGSCRCVGQENRDYCTCLPRVGSCHIQKGLPAAVGTATYRRESQTIYSCAATDNCMYDVHVVSSYESVSSFSHAAGTATVNLRVSGPSQDAKPLVLIFVTYEPVRWTLNVPSGVIIDKVLLASYYLETSSVSGVSSHIVERIPRQTLPSGYGDDSGGGSTDKLLMYVTDRFGPVASFSGTYSADYWELVIQRTPIESNCTQSTLNETELGDIHLSDGCTGELEVYSNPLNSEGWYRVCAASSGFSNRVSQVVCRQLGCPVNGASSTFTSASVSSLPSLTARFTCYGRESALSECQETIDRCSDANIITVRCANSTPPPPPPPPSTSSPRNGCIGGRQCLDFSSYCLTSGRYSATCVNGSCRCVGQKNRDYCTCLPRVGSCHIQKGLPAAVGTATYRRESQTIYSCAATDNCKYDVHVVSSYESVSSFSHAAGTATVNLRVSGPSQDAKPLVLIFVTYEPVRWTLNVPSGVTIDKVLLGSYYLETSSVSGVSSHIVERIPRQTLPSGYGDDSGGGSTDKLLMYVTDRFGPVASFSGTYRADNWELVIQRTPIESNCMQSTLNMQELGDVRLSDGCTGGLETYSNPRDSEGWYRVCAASSGFSDRESQVVCKQLGCPVNGASSTFTSTSMSSLPSLTARFTCYGRESALSECQETIDRCPDANIITVQCANKYQASALAGGISVGVVAFVGCIFALFIGVVCYKKGVCIKSTPRPSRLTRNNTYPTTYVTPAAPSGTQHLYQQPQHPYQLQPSNVHSTSTNLEERSHLTATTHAGEAPPAYHAAMHYETVILEDNKDLKLSEDSAVYRAKPAPPTYSEIISGQEDNLVNHE